MKKTKAQIHLRENGDVVLVTPVEFTAPSIRDTALALRSMGKKGIPLHEDHEALEGRDAGAVDAVLADHALLALKLLEAIHRGDPAPLRAIADAMKKADAEEASPPPWKRHRINAAVALAARKAKGEPKEEAVTAALVEIERQRSGVDSPSGGALDRSDKTHEMLERAGFDLEKENGRGDHLRRKSPK
jgi:hypothetical protein